jgi:molybdate transport system regulatory protein
LRKSGCFGNLGCILLEHSPAMPKVAATIQYRLRIHLGDDIAVGPGKVDLLEAIGATGSITAAAKALGMSYRRAWLLVDTMNRCFATPVVTAAAGGASGGRTQLTETGAEIVRRYRRMEAAAAKAGATDLAALSRLLRSPPASARGKAGRG